ncbi:hypothetical protein [Natronococcus roseus]|uniref:hypothetical protein n=1 Tax=Natronococcus roseus TaxID=1052014 RepID=UPI00374D5B23
MLCQDKRVPLIVALLAVSGIFLTGHFFERFYPWIMTVFFVSMSVLLLLAIRGAPFASVLSGALLVGITYRLYFNLHVPTPVGMSSQLYPERIDTLMARGELLGGYYSSAAGAPFQDLLFASSTIITGLGGYYSLFIYPLLIGTLYPLFGIAILKEIGVHDHRFLSVAAVLTLVTTEGLRRSYWSRNQVIATFFWLAAIYVLAKHLRDPDTRLFLLLAAFAGAMAYSHRLPLAIFAVVLLVLGILYLTDRISWNEVAGISPVKQVFSLFVFIGTVVLVQLLYLGNTFYHLVARIQRLLAQFGSDGVQSVPSQPAPSAANEVLPGIIGTLYQYPSSLSLFVERGHGIWIALVAGVAWTYLFFEFEERRTRGQILALLAVSAVGVALMFIGVVSIGSMNPTRPLQLIEPVLAVIIVIAIWKMQILDQKRMYQFGIGLVLVLLIASQVFAMAAGPDYANSPRYYADVPESAAKTTICEYSTEPIYTDHEMLMFRGLDQRTCEMDRIGTGPDSPLFNKNITPSEHPTFVYRHNVDIYHGSGGARYELAWNPAIELETNYHSVYNNNRVTMFEEDKTDS